MKQKRYIRLFGWLVATAMLLTTSCKDELFTNGGMSDEVTVKFTLTPEAAATVATRGTNYGGNVTYPDAGENPHISDGSKADVLIYAVYDSKGNLLEGYSEGVDPSLKDRFDHGNGQTVKKIDHFPTTITLTLKRGEQYSVAFWAQSSKTKAYNTEDLKKVEVIYGELEDETTTGTTTPNNDEYRDAFCRSVTISAGTDGIFEHNVYLYRPLAQINVGTSGFDYESITRNANKKYTYSKIRLNRVARYLDVVEDKTYASTTTTDKDKTYSTDDKDKTPEAFAVADFGYAPIPAYVNFEDEQGKIQVPEFPSYTIWDDLSSSPEKKEYYAKEEFLKVRLYEDMRGTYGYTEDSDEDNFLDYANMTANDTYRNSGGNGDLKSETFKYLSMCYVLTSSTKTDAITINNVKVWLATDADGSNEVEILNINNVPAQRNWRTNIVGNLLTEEQTFEVSLDKDFAGEYNMWNTDNGWELSGPIAKGVYYDAENDEIQISDADGLIWLQRMVNGDILVREDANNSTKPVPGYKQGDKFLYYDENGEEQTFSYEGYDYSKSDKQLQNRIIAATHIKDNTKLSQTDSNGWPLHKNYNFYNAKIKLMADIDLANIDWIPIGWDISLHDTSVARLTDGNGTSDTNMNYTDSQFTQGWRRIFCGTFNGNGHTIKNLHTFRVSASVHESSLQMVKRGPYDNFQWYPYGLFGMVVDYAKIENVRLQNVDIKGYDACGALVGIVFSGDKQKGSMYIKDCYVDGGTVSISPMYRGDSSDGKNPGVESKDRTFARGVFCGGLVGNIVIAEPNANDAPDFELTGCDVRNLTLRAYRQIGGLVGGIGNYENYKEGNSSNNVWDWNKQKFDLNISGNTISNVLVICNQFQAFNTLANAYEADKDMDNYVWRNGFGWTDSYRSLAGPVVGGVYVKDGDTEAQQLLNDYNSKNPHSNNVTITEFQTSREKGTTIRTAKIGYVPLYEMPMISSWFCDIVNLEANYYGQPSAYVGLKYKNDFAPLSFTAPSVTFSIPFRLPDDLSPYYDTSKPKAGLFVESVILDGGNNEVGGRSLITPEGVTTEGSCVMYVTARDRQQFYNKLSDDDKEKVAETSVVQSTVIKNVVLRGAPYAHTGLLMAPNQHMDKLTLENVAIYDVYQTIAKVDGATSNNSVDLSLTDCNLRGYTVPGSGWKSITFDHTTFEEGVYIKSVYGATGGNKEQAYTYKAEADAKFKHCYFKAPYVIDFNGKTLTFAPSDNDVTKLCYATAQSSTNVPINTIVRPEGKTADKVTKIRIISDVAGNPIVIYYYDNATTGYGHNGKGFTGKTYNASGTEIK